MPPKWCNYKLFWGHHHIFAKPILAVSKCLTATVAILQALNWTWPETTLAPQVWPRCRKSPETLVQVSHFVFHAFFFFFKHTIPFLWLITGGFVPPGKNTGYGLWRISPGWDICSETLKQFQIPLFPTWTGGTTSTWVFFPSFHAQPSWSLRTAFCSSINEADKLCVGADGVHSHRPSARRPESHDL